MGAIVQSIITMTEKTITLEATGNFPFTFYIEKAVAAENTEKEYILEGVASTANVDHDNERMSKDALQAMANKINEHGVPLRIEHSKSENAVVGDVFKAWVDERNQLHIRTRLDKSHPVAEPLYRAMMDEGKKMGFSVGGLVTRAMREFSEAAGKLVKTFYDVDLKEVSVTPRPANYDSWAVAKNIAKTEVEAEFSKSIFYDEFLSANPQLDYLQVFAKSVPDEAWRRVETSINKNNKDMTTKDDKKDEETEAAKSVSRADFNVLAKGVDTLARSITSFMEKFAKDGMDATPKDQNNPDKTKPEDESPAAKTSDKKEETEAEKEMGDEPKDQAAPAKTKPEDESPTAKATDKKDEYDIETVSRSIATLEAVTKRINKASEKTEEEEKEKAVDDKTDEKETEKESKDEKDEETAKGIHPLDVFVVKVTKAIEAMAEKMVKSGVNLIGFEKHMVERIVNDPVMQEEIHKMTKIPGAKRSLSLGIPYMVTKSGKRYGLTATEVGASTIEKSRASDGKKANFKDVYKAEFSSVREDSGE